MNLKQKIDLLLKVTEINVILALRSLFPWEGTFYETQEEEPIRVESAGDARHLFVAGMTEPLITAHEGDDQMVMLASPKLVDYPEICHALACLGLTALAVKDGFTLNAKSDVKGKITSEALWDRLLEMDALWINVHRHVDQMQSAFEAPKLFEKIYTHATQWASRRLYDFEQSSDGYAQETTVLLETICDLDTWNIPSLASVKIEGDIRGNAFNFVMKDGRVVYFMPLKFDWQPTKLIDANTRRYEVKTQFGKYDVRTTPVPVEVRAIMQGLLVHGNDVMITQRLNKKLYDKLNMVLQTIGGKWHTGRQVHVFEDDPSAILDEIAVAGAVYTRKDYEFFWTSTELARLAAAKADIRPGMDVLEPSAGDGALALIAAEVVGMDKVTCFELMPRNVTALHQKGFRPGEPTDFLAVKAAEQFDRVLMNPPFRGGRDAAHIRHAMGFLKPGGRLTAIASTQWQTHDTASARGFRDYLQSLGATVEQIPAGSFKEAGTEVETTLIVIDKPPIKAMAPTKALADKEFKKELSDMFF